MVIQVELTEDVLKSIRERMREVKIPHTHDKVYKDECLFSFDLPYSAGGLYVNLATWQGFGEDFLKLDVQRHGGGLYLQEKWRKVPLAEEMDTEQGEGKAQAEPTMLAIGVDGGFHTDDQKYDIIRDHALVVASSPDRLVAVPYPSSELPTIVSQACDAIIAHQGAAEQTEVNTWVADNDVVESKYARGLEQLSNGKKISNDPTTWRCEDSGLQENLWLNLSTGYIGSGRRNWDGSGGTGAALRHYEETGRKYPLAVKLGTITAQGADVYSYSPEEDTLVKDPLLAEHLKHWGIDIMGLEKTDKTMAELEVELNKSYDFSKITEAGKKLTPMSGPGYIGMKNLGNSCYLNSCMQLMCSLPEMGERYYTAADKVFQTAPEDPANDFVTQMSKLAVGLLSSRYAKPQPDEGAGTTANSQHEGNPDNQWVEVAPRMFKYLVGRGHPEFSTGKQQDAVEYLQHLLQVMTKAERTSQERVGGDPARGTAALFQFQLEDRIQCGQSGAVRYVASKENVLTLTIPMEAATNKEEVAAYKEREARRKSIKESGSASLKRPHPGAGSGAEAQLLPEEEEEVRPVVPFDACLQRFVGSEVLEDFSSPVTGQKGQAIKVVRFTNFPRYLFCQLRRYYVDESWQAKKLEVEVDVPETLDLSQLRAPPRPEGEQLMPDGDTNNPPSNGASGGGSGGAAAKPKPDDTLVAQLVSMGFPENTCKRAALAVDNSSAELAMNWLLEHMGDEGVDAPLEDPMPMDISGGAGGGGQAEVDPNKVVQLCSMGFTERQVTAALRATDMDMERAGDWLFSHMDDLDAAVASRESVTAGDTGAVAAPNGGAALEDGAPKYSLVGFISHVGRNTGCGHYVCHIKKEGRWVIFDDQKVARSESTPLRLGYVYLYRRDDAPSQI